MEVQQEGAEESDHGTSRPGSPNRDAIVSAPRKRRTYGANLAGAPSRGKRQRVTQACDQCRNRKEKCDAQHPACSTCISLKQTCTYGSSPRKRGLPAGYVRVLEMLWGLVFSKVAGSEGVVNALLGHTNKNGHPDWLVVMKKDGEDAESLLDIWRKSKACELIQRLLTSVEENKDTQGPNEVTTSQVSAQEPIDVPLLWHSVSSPGNGFTLEPEGRAFSQADKMNIDRDTAIPPINGADPAFQRPSGSRLISSNSALTFILPDNCWHLLELYFTFTHCWLPILEKHDMMRVAYTSSGKTLYAADLDSESGEHSVLWAVLTYASAQEAAMTMESPSIANSGSTSLSSEELYIRARSLVPSEDSEFGLGHVQTLLLLGLYKLGSGAKNAAWLLISHAVRVAVTIGLEGLLANVSGVEASASITNRSHHVFLGCFVLETLVSALTGRLPYLRSESLHRLGLLREDGLEEWDLWVNTVDQTRKLDKPTIPKRSPLHTLSVFNQLVKLFCILNDLLHVWPNSNDKVQQYSVYEAQLSDWHTQLPQHCRVPMTVDPSEAKHSPMLPHIWNLRLMYISTLTMFQTRALQCHQLSSELKIEAKGTVKVSVDVTMKLLKQYSELYGSALTPATFACYLYLAQIAIECYGAAEETFRFKLQFHGLSEMAKTWRGVGSFDKSPVPFSNDRTDSVAVGSSRLGLNTPAHYRTSPLNPSQPQVDDGQGRAEPHNIEDDNRFLPVLLNATAHQGPSTSAVPQYLIHPMENFDSRMEEFTTVPSHFPNTTVGELRSFSVFDELASLDGAEWLDRQPQFIQNLGFRSDNTNSLSLRNLLGFDESDIMSGLGLDFQQ